MSGVVKTQKSLISTDGGVTLVAQISGYGKSDSLVWGYSKDMLDLNWNHNNLRVRIDGKLFWFGTKRAGKEFRDFIFVYACEAIPGPDYGCLKEGSAFDYLIEDERLLNLIMQAKEIRLELPYYRKGNLIKTFK